MSAVAGPSTASYLGRAADYVRPDFHQVNLDIEGYLKTERNLKLDEGKSPFPRLLRANVQIIKYVAYPSYP